MTDVTVEHESVVAAPIESVWQRVVSPEGINHELRPWMTMSMPAGAKDLSIDTIEVGKPIGRSWIRLLGVLPVDYDDLTVAELVPGRSFREESTMLSARTWRHERTLTPAAHGGTYVHDRLTFAPRVPGRASAALHARVIETLFRHRHRRLAQHFGG